MTRISCRDFLHAQTQPRSGANPRCAAQIRGSRNPGRRPSPFLADIDARNVTDSSGSRLDLTSSEFDLLTCFLTRPKRVLSRDQLLDWTRGRRSGRYAGACR
ncbi:MAG: winged helix-turn-helix domain-containing protein [Xanthobacteraceae bacterium]|nr:winged helix-turn-helix domain-containing protein [Xanthobacteraceae bacterium]